MFQNKEYIKLPEGYDLIEGYYSNIYDIVDLESGVFDENGCPLCPQIIG